MKSITASRSHATASAEATAQALQTRRGNKYVVTGWVSLISGWFQASAGFMTSTLVHMLVILAMVWITGESAMEEGPVGLLLMENPPPPEIRELPTFTPVVEPVVGDMPEPKLAALDTLISTKLDTSPVDANDKAVGQVTLAPTPTYENTNLNQNLRTKSAGGFEGRGEEAQAQMLLQRGGSPATQDAVERALAWIAAQQNRENGSWDFDHRKSSPQGIASGNPGTAATNTGATGLALLPFLGKGYTHLKESPYQETVRKGLYYLQTNMIVHDYGGDLQQGNMYGHGLAAIALCEAYAMTEDPELEFAAQEAIRFIEYAQHNQGGWRYGPHEAGDTSVFGWQLMALKSGLIGNLLVSSQTVGLADYFLDTVQAENGSKYGYQRPGTQKTTSAIGLLCRMYLGWERYDQRLKNGAKFLAKEGPSETDMYYNYYATNVLSHMGEPYWKNWNRKLSNYLVKSQSNKSFESGSWYFQDRHAEKGGRLYVTCLSAMILEVYYRHMPLYSDSSIDFKF